MTQALAFSCSHFNNESLSVTRVLASVCFDKYYFCGMYSDICIFYTRDIGIFQGKTKTKTKKKRDPGPKDYKVKWKATGRGWDSELIVGSFTGKGRLNLGIPCYLGSQDLRDQGAGKN